MTLDELREVAAMWWEKGYKAAADAAGDCCGCNVYNSRHYDNPIKPT